MLIFQILLLCVQLQTSGKVNLSEHEPKERDSLHSDVIN